ncbi:hypothetical protein [Candidatus Villigracilis proximus]|uniref:aminotransferase class IV n=1 Tax=Candidatus Villigracilis proximus TaxID=3140683 RepID=UPI0031E50C22
MLCGLLAGTLRAHLLETGKIKERVIHKDELTHCTKIYLVNSVRKWVRKKKFIKEICDLWPCQNY